MSVGKTVLHNDAHPQAVLRVSAASSVKANVARLIQQKRCQVSGNRHYQHVGQNVLKILYIVEVIISYCWKRFDGCIFK